MSDTDALQPTVDFLRRHAPFAQMGTAELQSLAARAKLAFFARGEVITAPEQGPAEYFYIIKQGRVRGETGGDGEAWELVTGESFPIGALLGHRPVRTRHRAVEDTFCFELPRSEFDRLREASPVFGDFCARRLASLLDQALRRGAPASGTPASSPLGTPLGELIATQAVIAPASTALRDALAELEHDRLEVGVVPDGVEVRRDPGRGLVHLARGLALQVCEQGVGVDDSGCHRVVRDHDAAAGDLGHYGLERLAVAVFLVVDQHGVEGAVVPFDRLQGVTEF